MKFKNKLSPLYLTISFGLIGLTVFLALSKFQEGWETEDSIAISILGLTSILLSTFVFKRNGTYEIDNEFVHYNMKPILAGKIEINKIRKIEMNTSQWVGLKASTAMRGIIIHYNSYDEIFIGPENQKAFVDELLRINSDIEIIQN